ncbi:type VI secretion protein, partial [Amycolatopsis rhizosphaerae]
MRPWIPAALPHPSEPSSGWLGDYLRDPGGALSALLDHVRDWAVTWGPIAGPLLVLGFVGGVLGRWRWARHRHARLLADARQVTVLAPPQVDPAGGAALWSNLVGLLRPAWRRWLIGQPHVACEYCFSEAGVAIRLWVPGVIPPGLVERAIEAAWPGAHTRTTSPPQPPLPPPGPGQRQLVIAGELRLARPEALPIRTDFDADPIRTLIGAPVGLDRDEYACVQILARPVTGRRVATARRSARRLHTRGPTRLVGRLLDQFTPGMKPRRPSVGRTGSGALHSEP